MKKYSIFEVKIQIYLFDEREPRYEVLMPTIKPHQLIIGGLATRVTGRIIDPSFNKCTG